MVSHCRPLFALLNNRHRQNVIQVSHKYHKINFSKTYMHLSANVFYLSDLSSMKCNNTSCTSIKAHAQPKFDSLTHMKHWIYRLDFGKFFKKLSSSMLQVKKSEKSFKSKFKNNKPEQG